MTGPQVRYLSREEDSGRWDGFPFRRGDIVISTRSKSGTTWVQMICALLVFRTPELPEPLGRLSPWVDHLVTPRDVLIDRLDSQRHRRILKTHTPLDGVPIEPEVFYIVVARHPLDMAVSLYHQGDNIDRDEVSRLIGRAPPEPKARMELRDWLAAWIEGTASPNDEMDGLPGVMWHLSDAWARRHEANVVLVHYDDLSADLPAEMRRLERRLDLEVTEAELPVLAEAASFDAMKRRAELAVPGSGILKDPAAFFRHGTSGDGARVLAAGGYERYLERARELAPADLLEWLHR